MIQTTSRRNYQQLVDNFAFEGDFINVQPYGYGHINETFAVQFQKSNGKNHRYILQRINHKVFHNPAEVMHNYSVITNFLREKIVEAGGNPWRETINLIPAKNGQSFIQSDEGEFWRAEIFIEDAQTYQFPTHPNHLYNASWAFGNFGRLLNDFPVNQLFTTIPEFHHTPKRFQAFISALELDPHNRAGKVKNEIEFILNRESDTSKLIELQSAGKLPVRVTHNDTKFENVMIDDQTGKGICVIDLDTVMPGIILFDFGDAVRSGANPSSEDETDLSKVIFRLDIFEELIHGYLDAARDFLIPIELDYLAFASRLITLEQAIRFLTDYLLGDIYYRTHRPGQNLDRCRTQIKLVADMETSFDKMIDIVNLYR